MADIKLRLRNLVPSHYGSCEDFKKSLAKHLGLNNEFCPSSFVIENLMSTATDISGFLTDISQSFLNSPAFRSSSRYGNYKFTFPLDTILERYEDSICGDVEVDEKYVFRVLGTFRYPWEVMQAIVVHPNTPRENELFEECPVFDVNTPTPAVRIDGKRWIWTPESTGDRRFFPNANKQSPQLWHHFVRNDPRCWEHLSFAFHIPEDKEGIEFGEDELRQSCSICEIESPYLGKGSQLDVGEAGKVLSEVLQSL